MPDEQGPPATGVAVREDPWVGRLFDEYKMLQDKIDKIGSFRFTIKGWSVTVTAGGLAAATAANAAAVTALLPLLVTVAFFLLERKQNNLSQHFMDRAGEIETIMVRLRAGSIRDVSTVAFIPGIATTMRKAGAYKSRTIAWRKIAVDPEYWIYVIQAVVILSVAGWIAMRPAPRPAPSERGIVIGPIYNGDDAGQRRDRK